MANNYNNDDLTKINAVINPKPSVGAADDVEKKEYLDRNKIVIDSMLSPYMGVPLAIPGPELIQQAEAEMGGGEWLEDHTVQQKGRRGNEDVGRHYKYLSGQNKVRLYIAEQEGKPAEPTKGFFEQYDDDSPYDGSRG